MTLAELVKRFEGFSQTPYRCPAGYWTIGYGHLCSPDHPPITIEEGERLLLEDLGVAINASYSLCPVLYSEPEARLLAVADFAFNLGSGRLKISTMRRRINQRDWVGAARECRRWVWGGGKILPGLVVRREVEAKMLLEGRTNGDVR